MKIWTIGYSPHTIDSFITLLKEYGVTAIADVRSSPFSRRYQDFNRSLLKDSLNRQGIAYSFLGDQLGARSSNPNCYKDGVALYELIAASDEFKVGLGRIRKGSESYRIALMCAEKDPLTCHRAVLVSRWLKEEGFDVRHLLANGTIETHEALENRMIKMFEPPRFQGSIFEPDWTPLPRESVLAEAYRACGLSIAYVAKPQGK